MFFVLIIVGAREFTMMFLRYARFLAGVTRELGSGWRSGGAGASPRHRLPWTTHGISLATPFHKILFDLNRLYH